MEYNLEELVKALECCSSDEHKCDHNCRYYKTESEETVQDFRKEYPDAKVPEDFFCYCDSDEILNQCLDAIKNVTPKLAKYRWHDLRKDENDLPYKYILVITCLQGHDVVRCMDGETMEQAIERISKIRSTRICFLGEDGWYSHSGYPVVARPIAWRYIEDFEEDLNV